MALRQPNGGPWRLNGIPAIPTPVASGVSPVTPGDLAYVVERLQMLDRSKLRHLALGSARDPHDCNVCGALREMPARYTNEQTFAVNELLAWHGSDGLRCGVIYGAAAALLAGKPSR